jgi:hypothetical protein
VFDSQELLTGGTFSYLNWEQRKPYTLHGQGHLSGQDQVTLTPSKEGGFLEDKALEALQTLTDPANFSSPPNRSSCSEMCWSTSQDGMGVNIGGSFFYMGMAETQQFSFSSERYRYLYVYMFDQIFAYIKAEQPSQTKDLFSGFASQNDNALFLLEATYGRRIYALIESESALENYSSGIPGGLEWLLMSAKLQQPAFLSKANGHVNIRLQTQDGSWLGVSDYSQLQTTIDDYFRTSCLENPLSPLSYKVSDLDGTPVSLLTTVFLDSQQCLTSPKARVRLREIKLSGANTMDPIGSGEIYGRLNLHLFHACGHELPREEQFPGQSQQQDHALAGTITIASRESPLRLSRGKAKAFGSHDPENYIDVDITSLDMLFQLEPVIKERVSTGDHAFSIHTDQKKKLRQILMEGSTGTTLQCCHDTCQLELTVDITPL